MILIFIANFNTINCYGILFRSRYSDGPLAGRPDFDFFLLHIVHTGSGTHTASCPLNSRGDFPCSKAAGA
jgi:hypothetical protein